MKLDENGNILERYHILVSHIAGTFDGNYDGIPLNVAILYRWKRPASTSFLNATTRIHTAVGAVDYVWEVVEMWKIKYDVAIRDIQRGGFR